MNYLGRKWAFGPFLDQWFSGMTPIGRAGSPLPAARTQAKDGAHGVTRPTAHLQMTIRQIPSREFSRGRRTRLRLRCVNLVAADVSPLILFRQEEFEPAHAGCYDEIDGRPARQSIRFPATHKRRAGVWP
jgi:hypothetical protein